MFLWSTYTETVWPVELGFLTRRNAKDTQPPKKRCVCDGPLPAAGLVQHQLPRGLETVLGHCWIILSCDFALQPFQAVCCPG